MDNLKKLSKNGLIKNHIKDEIVDFQMATFSSIEQGYLHTNSYTGIVTIVNGMPYKMRGGMSIIEMANAFWGSEYTELIIGTTQQAMADILKARTFEESKMFNRPVRLFAVA